MKTKPTIKVTLDFEAEGRVLHNAVVLLGKLSSIAGSTGCGNIYCNAEYSGGNYTLAQLHDAITIINSIAESDDIELTAEEDTNG